MPSIANYTVDTYMNYSYNYCIVHLASDVSISNFFAEYIADSYVYVAIEYS